MDLPEELQFDRLSYEEKYRRAVPGYMRRINGLYEAVYERFGEDGLELIREVSVKYGASIANNLKKKGEFKGVMEVGKYLLKVFDMVCDDWAVAEYSEDRMVITVSRCPYPFRKPEICQAHTCMEQTLVTTLDDTLDYHVGASIPAGDPLCEHVLTRKTTRIED